MENFQWIIFGLPLFLLAGTVHEYMHAYTAKRLGDYTAAMEGRLTLNPLAHIDPFGLLLMVLVRFGWMRPVPVNEYNFEKPVRDMALTAIAGPVSNLVMGVTSYFIAAALFSSGGLVTDLLIMFAWINFALMTLNMIPIPPLDGYRVLRAFLPDDLRYYWENLEQYAWIILLAFFLPFSPISGLLSGIIFGGVNLMFEILGSIIAI